MKKVFIPTDIPPYYAQQFNSNSFLYEFAMMLIFAIIAVVIYSAITFAIAKITSDNQKKTKLINQLKAVPKVLLVLIIPIAIILVNINFFDLQPSYPISGDVKNYGSSDFFSIACYGIAVVILSLLSLIIGIVRLIKNKTSNKSIVIFEIVVSIIMLALYSWHCYEMLMAMNFYK